MNLQQLTVFAIFTTLFWHPSISWETTATALSIRCLRLALRKQDMQPVTMETDMYHSGCLMHPLVDTHMHTHTHCGSLARTVAGQNRSGEHSRGRCIEQEDTEQDRRMRGPARERQDDGKEGEKNVRGGRRGMRTDGGKTSAHFSLR